MDEDKKPIERTVLMQIKQELSDEELQNESQAAVELASSAEHMSGMQSHYEIATPFSVGEMMEVVMEKEKQKNTGVPFSRVGQLTLDTENRNIVIPEKSTGVHQTDVMTKDELMFGAKQNIPHQQMTYSSLQDDLGIFNVPMVSQGHQAATTGSGPLVYVGEVMKAEEDVGAPCHSVGYRTLHMENLSATTVRKPSAVCQTDVVIKDEFITEPEQNLINQQLTVNGTKYHHETLHKSMAAWDHSAFMNESDTSVGNQGAVTIKDEPHTTNQENMTLNDLGDDLTRSLFHLPNLMDGPNSSASPRINRSRRKAHCCKFCTKVVTHFTRHLTNVHSAEKEVQILNSGVNMTEKLNLLRKIRKDGDSVYNLKNPTRPIVVRRSVHTRRDKCPCCLGMYSSSHFMSHIRKCSTTFESMSNDLCGDECDVTVGMHEALKTRILPPMKDDEVRELCSTDSAIILFANEKCERYVGEHYENMIRNDLCIVGHIVLELFKIDPDMKKVEQMFAGGKYSIFERAIKNVFWLRHNEAGEIESIIDAHRYGPVMLEVSSYLRTYLIKHRDTVQSQRSFYLINSKIANIDAWQYSYNRKYDKQIASLTRLQNNKSSCDSSQLLHKKGESVSEYHSVPEELLSPMEEKKCPDSRKRRFARRNVKEPRTRWSLEVKAALAREFRDEIRKKRCPSTEKVLEAMRSLSSAYPILLEHSPLQIKTVVYNLVKSKLFRQEVQDSHPPSNDAMFDTNTERESANLRQRSPEVPFLTGSSTASSPPPPMLPNSSFKSDCECTSSSEEEEEPQTFPLKKNKDPDSRKRRFAKRKATRKRTRWSLELKTALAREFRDEITNKQCPTTQKVLQVMQLLSTEYPTLRNHSHLIIKTLVCNLGKSKQNLLET